MIGSEFTSTRLAYRAGLRHAALENRFARNVLNAALPSRVASDMVVKGCSERSIGRDLPATQISHRQGLSPGSRRFTTTE
jgi:hypothetical protein